MHFTIQFELKKDLCLDTGVTDIDWCDVDMCLGRKKFGRSNVDQQRKIFSWNLIVEWMFSNESIVYSSIELELKKDLCLSIGVTIY